MSKQVIYKDSRGCHSIPGEMLPCPCCGGEPELIFRGNDYSATKTATIKCKGCRLQRTDASMTIDATEQCIESALEQWNKRI